MSRTPRTTRQTTTHDFCLPARALRSGGATGQALHERRCREERRAWPFLQRTAEGLIFAIFSVGIFIIAGGFS